MYNSNLDYRHFGFHSLAQMCVELSIIFFCIQPEKGDFIIFERNKKINKNELTKKVFKNVLKDQQPIVGRRNDALPFMDVI